MTSENMILQLQIGSDFSKKLSKLSKIRQPSSLDKTGKTTLTNSSRIFANGYTSRVAAIIYAPTVLNKKKNSKYGMEEHMA